MREIDVVTQAHLDANPESLIVVLLARLSYETGDLLVNTSGQSIFIEEEGEAVEEYLGVGTLGTVEAIEDSATPSASGISLTLSGIPATGNLATALGEDYQGRPATLSLAILDSDYKVVGKPVVLFRGRQDNMTITMGASASVQVSLENRWADWERTKVSRYNNAEQQSRFLNDFGLLFVEQTVDKELSWG